MFRLEGESNLGVVSQFCGLRVMKGPLMDTTVTPQTHFKPPICLMASALPSVELLATVREIHHHGYFPNPVVYLQPRCPRINAPLSVAPHDRTDDLDLISRCLNFFNSWCVDLSHVSGASRKGKKKILTILKKARKL